jgi:hypothetical protein
MGRGIRKSSGGDEVDIRDVAKQIPDKIKEMSDDSPNEHDVLNDILEGAGESAVIKSIFEE